MTYDFGNVGRSSRELHLAVDADGNVVFADDRAIRCLGIEANEPLAARVAPGCEAKLDELLACARDGAVDDWEIPFVVRGKPITLSLSGEPSDGKVLLIGHRIPDAFIRAMEQNNAMIAEVVELNRQIARQNLELRRMNTELADSYRGIQALHAELQEAQQSTRQDNEIKTRVVANLSHELRTPLHSILGLTHLLQSGVDGKLGGEQAKQISFIRSSAEELLDLINDVLDLGQLDSGHGRLRIDPFDLGDLVSSLRGSLRPLVPPDSPITLIIDEPPAIRVDSDRTKIAQVVRNLVSNAIKFTEHGKVHVSFALTKDRMKIMVADDGLGIAPEDHDKIFEEYGQIEHALQRKLKGTGLGLPLSRRLATALGGTLTVDSSRGHGSTFTLDIPLRHDEARAMTEMLERSRVRAPDATSILVVEDDRKTLFLYEKYLVMAGFHVMPARSVDEAEKLMAEQRPAAIVLDVMLEGDASWGFLARTKQDPRTRDIPVLVVTVTNRADKARALGADEFWLKPVDQDRLLRKLREIAGQPDATKVLVIDDDETARYIIRRHLDGSPYEVVEASNGPDGVALARKEHPKVILLDFLLEKATAFDVLDELKADPATRGIPVIIVTSHVLDAVDQKRLLAEAQAVISKQNLSRELAINRIRDALARIRP